MGSTPFNTKTQSNVDNERKITFNDEPQFFTIMTSNEERIFNANNLENRNTLSHKTAKKDGNSNNIEQNPRIKGNLKMNSRFGVNEEEEKADIDKEDVEKDISLDIISDKVVLLMMSTGGVTDKYTPAVRSMQEGKLI